MCIYIYMYLNLLTKPPSFIAQTAVGHSTHPAVEMMHQEGSLWLSKSMWFLYCKAVTTMHPVPSPQNENKSNNLQIKDSTRKSHGEWLCRMFKERAFHGSKVLSPLESKSTKGPHDDDESLCKGLGIKHILKLDDLGSSCGSYCWKAKSCTPCSGLTSHRLTDLTWRF